MTTTPTTAVAVADPPVPSSSIPCAYYTDPACAVPTTPDDPTAPTTPVVIAPIIPIPTTTTIVDESITNVEMCLPSGTTRWTFLKCEPSCGYITFEKGELICHGSVLPSSEVHSLPDTGTTSVPAIGGAGALLALGLVLARIARRTSRPVRSSR